MDNVSASFSLSISLKGDNSDIVTADLGTAIDNLVLTRGVTYASGTGSDQVDVIYHDILPVTDNQEIDLNGSALKDAFGVGLAITKLKALFIKNLTGAELDVGGATQPLLIVTTPATEKVLIADGGQHLWTWPGEGITITGAGQLEFVHGAGGSQNIEIIAVGVR